MIAAIAATGIEVRQKDTRDLDALLPTRSRDITMIVDDSVYGLRIPSAMVPSDDPAGSLDVSILQERILASVLGIHNARSDERLSYAPGVEGIAGLMERCKKGWRSRICMLEHNHSRSDGSCRCRSGNAAEINLVRSETQSRNLSSLLLKAKNNPSVALPVMKFFSFLVIVACFLVHC